MIKLKRMIFRILSTLIFLTTLLIGYYIINDPGQKLKGYKEKATDYTLNEFTISRNIIRHTSAKGISSQKHGNLSTNKPVIVVNEPGQKLKGYKEKATDYTLNKFNISKGIIRHTSAKAISSQKHGKKSTNKPVIGSKESGQKLKGYKGKATDFTLNKFNISKNIIRHTSAKGISSQKHVNMSTNKPAIVVNENGQKLKGYKGKAKDYTLNKFNISKNIIRHTSAKGISSQKHVNMSTNKPAIVVNENGQKLKGYKGKAKDTLNKFNISKNIIRHTSAKGISSQKHVNMSTNKPAIVVNENGQKLKGYKGKAKDYTLNKFNISKNIIRHTSAKGISSQKHGNLSTNKPVIAIAIFSLEAYADKRKAVRETWLSKIDEIPFDFKYKFVLDRPTPETEKERQLYQDIIYTNMSAALSGYAVCFSTRMLKWYEYAVTNFPKAELIGKMDDDVFPCIPQLFERIFKVKTKRLYYGWKHGGKNQEIERLNRVDEMFVLLGRELIDRILKRKYCGCFVDPKLSADCNERNSSTELASDPFADMAIAMWLSHYNDVDRVSDNRYITHFSFMLKDRVKNYNYAVPKFCVKKLIFHKSSVNIMYKLHHYNLYFRAGNKLPSIQSPPVGYSRPVPLTLSTFTEGKPVERKDKFCDLWVVSKPLNDSALLYREAIQMFTSNNWCVIIIGDYGSHLHFRKANFKNNVVFLPPEKHEVRFPAMSYSLFWNHIGRRNIGFLYAMHHGAKYIFDFYHDANLSFCIENVVQNFSTNYNKSEYDILECGGTIWSCAEFKAMALPTTVHQNHAHVYRSAIGDLILGKNKYSSTIQSSKESNITMTIKRILSTAPTSIKHDIEGIYTYMYTKGLIEYDDVAFSKIWMKSINATCA